MLSIHILMIQHISGFQFRFSTVIHFGTEVHEILKDQTGTLKYSLCASQ